MHMLSLILHFHFFYVSKLNGLIKSDFKIPEKKTSVQEVSLLINQEHEILYSLSNSIPLFIVIGILKSLQK